MNARHGSGLLFLAACLQLGACRSAGPRIEYTVAAELPGEQEPDARAAEDETSIAASAKTYALRLGETRRSLHQERSEAEEGTEVFLTLGAAAPFLDGFFGALIAEAKTLQYAAADATEALTALERFRDRRKEVTDALFEAVDFIESLDDVFRYQGLEIAAYDATLRPFLADEFVKNLVVRTALLERKYFHGEDEGGNFLEGWINGKLGFTRFDADSEAWYREDGVSRLETTVRLEPSMSLENGTKAAVLLSGGMLCHFFPDVEAIGFDSKKDDDFLSNYVRRVGLRVGVGAMESSGVIAGGGLQIRSVTLWLVRDFDDDEWVALIGLNDLAFLKSYLPWFGK